MSKGPKIVRLETEWVGVSGREPRLTLVEAGSRQGFHELHCMLMHVYAVWQRTACKLDAGAGKDQRSLFVAGWLVASLTQLQANVDLVQEDS